MTNDYVVLRFCLLVAAAGIALSNAFLFTERTSIRLLSLAFGLFVIARIIRQYL